VIHTKAGFAAFSAACTHVACLVTWNEATQQIFCPCHGAYFDTKGNVLSGPPPRPLPAFPVSVVGEKIYIGGA
jgi:cytochrome b6-f complex iron-sulfur subunit